MIIETRNQDILKSDINIIAHQVNCVSKGSRGLARQIFDKYPNSNIYTKVSNRNLGQVYITFEDDSKLKILHLTAQIYTGKPRDADRYVDRLKAFKECIYLLENNQGISREFIGSDVMKIETLRRFDIIDGDVVGFPYGIGCGLAGGNWDDYYKILDESKLKIILFKI